MIKKVPKPVFFGGKYQITKPDRELFNILVCSAITEIIPYSANNNPHYYGMVHLVINQRYSEVLEYLSEHLYLADSHWREYMQVWDCKREELPDPRDLMKLKDLIAFITTLDYLNQTANTGKNT